MSVPRAHYWRDNGAMMADVAQLGYLEGRVLDVTYGKGVFWKHWKPEKLTVHEGDFRFLPYLEDEMDAVVLDGPYKLNGTSRPQDRVADERYGVHVPASPAERHQLLADGLVEALRVARRYVLFKCMDQVVSGQVHWQTDTFTAVAQGQQAAKVDRFDFLRRPRRQPARLVKCPTCQGRGACDRCGDLGAVWSERQVHAQANYSTLLVFSAR